MEQKHVQGESKQSQLCVYVYAQQCHFVDVYGDKTRDEKYQCPGKICSAYDTCLPNQFVHVVSFYSRAVQHAVGTKEICETHQICV